MSTANVMVVANSLPEGSPDQTAVFAYWGSLNPFKRLQLVAAACRGKYTTYDELWAASAHYVCFAGDGTTKDVLLSMPSEINVAYNPRVSMHIDHDNNTRFYSLYCPFNNKKESKNDDSRN